MILNSDCLLAQQNFFPIGIFDTWKQYAHVNANQTNLDEISANSGFNVIQSYGYYNLVDGGTLSDVKLFLDTAYSRGFKVLLCTPFSSSDTSRPFLELGSYSAAINLIEFTKNHPALYGFYIADEPNDRSMKNGVMTKFISSDHLKLAHDTLLYHAKNNFGQTIPMFISLADGSTPDISSWSWHSYNLGTDFVINDTYINHNNSHQSSNWVKLLHKYDDLLNHNQSVQALISVEAGGTPPTHGAVRNTWDELRFQTYTAIIHGVQGVWYYGYYETYNPPQVNWKSSSAYFVDTLAPLSKQLSQIVNLLSGTRIGDLRWGDRSGYSFATSTDSIEYVIKLSGSTYLIIVANISSIQKNSAHFYLNTLPTNSATTALKQSINCAKLSENSTSPTANTFLTIVNGVLTDTFAPYSVHVYTFSN